MAGIYQKLYIITNNAVKIFYPAAGFLQATVPDVMTPGQTYVTGLTLPDTTEIYPTMTYEGYGEDNDVFMTYVAEDDSSRTYLYSNNTYTENTVPDPNDAVAKPFAACFLDGVRISTPDGGRAVETLEIGDLVLTADGRAVPVKWIGRQLVSAMFNQAPHRLPVFIAAGALGERLPERDLKLTTDHALLLDGVLVQAGALVNGDTIRRMDAEATGARYTVWHIETEDHEVILAENCPAETFVDNASRGRFDNFEQYVALYGGEDDNKVEMDLPRVLSERQLPSALRARIAKTKAA